MAEIDSTIGQLSWKERLRDRISRARQRVADALDTARAVPPAVKNVLATRKNLSGTLNGPSSGATTASSTPSTGVTVNQPATASPTTPNASTTPPTGSQSAAAQGHSRRRRRGFGGVQNTGPTFSSGLNLSPYVPNPSQGPQNAVPSTPAAPATPGSGVTPPAPRRGRIIGGGPQLSGLLAGALSSSFAPGAPTTPPVAPPPTPPAAPTGTPPAAGTTTPPTPGGPTAPSTAPPTTPPSAPTGTPPAAGTTTPPANPAPAPGAPGAGPAAGPRLSSVDFLNGLGITPDEIAKNPAARAISLAVDEYALTHPDFEDVKRFLDDPRTLIGTQITDKENAKQQLEDSIAADDALMQTIRVSLAKATPAERASYAPQMQTASRNISRAKNQIAALNKEIEELRKRDMGSRRKNMNRKNQLDMLNLFFIASDAIQNNEAVNYDEVVGKSREFMAKAEGEHLEQVSALETFWRKYLDGWRPDLTKTLVNTVKEDKYLKVIPADYFAGLEGSLDEVNGVQDWVNAIPVEGAATDEQKEERRMTVFLPLILGHLKNMVNVGGRARLNVGSIEKAKKLIKELGQLEWGYQIKKGKEAPGQLIDKMLAYSQFEGAAEAQEGQAKKDIVDDITGNASLKKLGATLRKAVLGTAFAVTTLSTALSPFGPLIATLGVGGAMAAIYRSKSDKTEAEIKKDKLKSNLLAVGTLLSSGGIYLSGLTAWPVLGIAGGILGIKYGYQKNAEKIKELAKKAKNILSGFIS